MALNFFVKHRHILFYGVCLALLLFLLNWLKLRLVILDHAFEIYVGAIALIFTALGIWFGLKVTKPKVEKVIVRKDVYVDRSAFVVNEAAVTSLAISSRELQVLQLMAEGHSNKEIANQLFVSVSTIKTHGNNLFDKLEVKRRTQAIDKARKLGIIP
jgi:two-component system, NarL family, response regulator LiaR